MAIVRCGTPGCPHFTREGSRNPHIPGGADGRYCYRCRAKQMTKAERAERKRRSEEAAARYQRVGS